MNLGANGTANAEAAAEVLRASVAEQLRALGERPLSGAVLDVAGRRLALAGGDVLLVQPRSWSALADAYRAARRPTPFWATLWPSAIELAGVLEAEPPTGLRVLELGCGLGLPSVVAARAGAAVTATDVRPEAVAFTAHNLALNDVEGDAAVADWGDPEPLAALGPWDLVIGADLLYTRAMAEGLIAALPGLLAPGGEAWLADPGRAGAAVFLGAAEPEWSIDTRRGSGRQPVDLHRLRAADAGGA